MTNFGILSSKKFQALLIGMAATALVTYVPALEPMKENLNELLALVVAYIVGQGVADLGKERAKIEGQVDGDAQALGSAGPEA